MKRDVNVTPAGDLACGFGYPWLLHDTEVGCPACEAYFEGADYETAEALIPSLEPRLPIEGEQ